MKSRFSQFKKLTSRAAAILLCIWLSGALCALNCQITNAQTIVSIVETASAEENENLPPCHRKAAREKPAEAENGEDTTRIKKSGVTPMMACCAFLNPTFERAKNFNFVPQAKPAKTAILQIAVFQKQRQYLKNSYISLPRDRGGTYLKNRVLLI